MPYALKKKHTLVIIVSEIPSRWLSNRVENSCLIYFAAVRAICVAIYIRVTICLFSSIGEPSKWG